MYLVNLYLASKPISGQRYIHIYTVYDSIFLSCGLKATSDFMYSKSNFILKTCAGLVSCMEKSHSYYSSDQEGYLYLDASILRLLYPFLPEYNLDFRVSQKSLRKYPTLHF